MTFIFMLKVVFFIWLEALAKYWIHFITLERALTVFTHSDITPPKLSRFGLNLEHPEYIVWAG